MQSGFIINKECRKTLLMNMKCPKCQSSNTRKDGHQNGKQRWECKDCGRIFRDSYMVKSYHPQIKQFCLTTPIPL